MEVKQKLAAEPAIEGIPNRSRIAPFNRKRDVWAMKHTTDLLKKIHKGIGHDGKDD